MQFIRLIHCCFFLYAILVAFGIQVSMYIMFISWPGEMMSNSRSIARNFNAVMRRGHAINAWYFICLRWKFLL